MRRERKRQLPSEVAVPAHGGFLGGVAVHHDFVGDALLAGAVRADLSYREQRQKGRGRSGSRNQRQVGLEWARRTQCAKSYRVCRVV